MTHSASAAFKGQVRTQDRDRPLLDDVFATRISEQCHPGHVIFWEGDIASDIIKITDGVLRLYRILPDGRRAITGFAFSGDILSLGFHDCCLYTAEAVTKVRLRRFPHQRMQALASECPELRQEILHIIALELEAAQEQMVLLGQKSAEERVASFLLMNGLRTIKDRTGPITYDLLMTRLDMADYLGLTIETVCRAVTKLKNAGFVCFEGRHRVLLNKLSELAHFAGHDNLERSGINMPPNRPPWPQPVPLSLGRDQPKQLKPMRPLCH